MTNLKESFELYAKTLKNAQDYSEEELQRLDDLLWAGIERLLKRESGDD